MRDYLKKAFDFDESDVLLNQNGQLSEKQIELISVIQRIYKIGGRVAFVVMFISIGLVTLIPLYAVGFEYLKKYPEMAWGLLALFSISWSLFLFSCLLGKLRSDLKSRKISMVEGFAEHRTKMYRRWRAYYVTIGEVKFQVDTPAKYKAFKPNIYYRVFYIRHLTHIILSVAEITAQK